MFVVSDCAVTGLPAPQPPSVLVLPGPDVVLSPRGQCWVASALESRGAVASLSRSWIGQCAGWRGPPSHHPVPCRGQENWHSPRLGWPESLGTAGSQTAPGPPLGPDMTVLGGENCLASPREVFTAAQIRRVRGIPGQSAAHPCPRAEHLPQDPSPQSLCLTTSSFLYTPPLAPCTVP